MGCRSFWPGNCETVKLWNFHVDSLPSYAILYIQLYIYVYIFNKLNGLSTNAVVLEADCAGRICGRTWPTVRSPIHPSTIQYQRLGVDSEILSSLGADSSSEILEGVTEEMHLVDLVYRTCLPCPFSGKHGATTSSMRSLCRPLADKDTWANR